MYAKYVEVLARHATEIFSDMTGTEVLNTKVKIDERLGLSPPLSHLISYEHLEKAVKGHFILGFDNNDMAISVAAALAEKMGLPSIDDMDEIATDLLNEFMNTIVGRTISEWDHMGMPVKFSPPSSVKFSQVAVDESLVTNAYIIMLSLTFSHIIFRVTFSEENQLKDEDRRILVVEDSAVIRNIIARTLQQFRFNVQQAENGQRATELYPEFRPHLVLMDLVMPEMGGLEAISTIRKFDPNARFIVLTSSARRDQVLEAKKMKVLSYLIKPFNPDLLMKEVKKAFSVTRRPDATYTV